jgi:hypothetical protein
VADRRIRAFLLVLAAFQGVVAVLFAAGLLTETPFWPFPGTTPLSAFLLSSLAAAASASTAWCALAGRERALIGIGLDYLTIFIPFAVITALRLGDLGSNGGPFLVTCLGAIALGSWMVAWGRRFAWRDARPTPTVVRGAFAFFILALLVVSGLLFAGVPNVLPWQITPDLSLLFGFGFLGAAAYFGFGLLEPRWDNAVGQLVGFLAYDLVLIVPFVTRLPTVADEHRVGQLIYLAVVVGSGLLATWYLVVRRDTRIWVAAPAPAA